MSGDPTPRSGVQALDYERLRYALEGARDGLWDWNVVSGDVYFSPQWCRMLGFEPEEIPPTVHSWSSLVHPEDLGWVTEAVQAHIDGRTDAYETTHRVRRKDGSYSWILDRGRAVARDAAGKAVRMVGTHADVTDAKRREILLAAMNETATTDPTSDAFFERLVGVLIDALPSRWAYIGALEPGTDAPALQMLAFGERHDLLSPLRFALPGTPAAEVLGRHEPYLVEDGIATLFPRDEILRRQSMRSYLGVALRRADGTPIGILAVIDDAPMRASPELRALASIVASRAAAELARRQVELARAQAEAESRELTLRLQQAERLEAIGRLAGGVAHEFNNLLTVILGNLDVLRESLPAEGEPQEALGAVQEAGDRAAELVRQLLVFSRRQPMAPAVVDLNAVVGGQMRLLRRVVDEDVSLESRPTPQPLPVLADPGHVEQVVTNLVMNARDAVRRRTDDGPRRITVTTCIDPEPRQALVEVRDTGVGISADALPRLFEPFYSTKSTLHGTGLGLPSVYGLVRSAGGDITVKSAPGVGTAFTVRWPLAPSETVDAGRPASPDAVGHPQRSAILAEDDAHVQRVLVRMLERLGFRVAAYPSGDAARAALERLTAPPDLLVSDVRMPNGGGIALAEAARARFPDLAVLLISGYADEDVPTTPRQRFLLKPVSTAGFSEALDALGLGRQN